MRQVAGQKNLDLKTTHANVELVASFISTPRVSHRASTDSLQRTHFDGFASNKTSL